MAWHTEFPGAYAYVAGERPHTHNPFFDFIRLVDGSAGGGVDHRGFYTGFPFAGPGPHRARGGGCHGRGGPRHRGHRHGHTEPRGPAQDPEKSTDAEMSDNPEKAQDSENVQDPPEVAPETESEPQGCCGGNRRGGCGGRGRGGRHGPHGRPAPPFPFDPSVLSGLFNHPLAQGLRDLAEQASAAADPSSSSADVFTPPLDVFESETEYVLHLALPGAKKEDVGVHWDADKGELRISGVVHRPGDEAFLQGMRSSERRVGEFGRTVKLPPTEGASRKEDVDGDAISAKMEDGVLIVVVPKVEKDEWTEVRKVDIE
ncbi:uncharacterized protein DNG_03550 [Cephalotrichum gorgonifer]|uniref:SHSP domain-containing protein n=1 Tax=Cephalotrichum gorgonifer TaxID=2041049 RepID=A0AAE8MWA0_9PEZI|nr:uncharacterized protein DNG_03550 [Cephalotrichum gorgonifer]